MVFADQYDEITDATSTNQNGSCEKVIRGTVKAGDDSAENNAQSPSNDHREK